MAGWNDSDLWPQAAGWATRKDDLLQAVAEFAADRLRPGRHERPLVVSSNGVLRFLPRVLLGDAGGRTSFKMRTGHLGIIERTAGQTRLCCWDVAPADLPAAHSLP
jgi:broad specificity phosphatase PhoE